MSWLEHSPVPVPRAEVPATPGTVTISARRGSAGLDLVVVVSRNVQLLLPWYRGGADVTVTLGDRAQSGMMRIARGGPHRLLGAGGTLDKMPPVVLRMPRLPWMLGEDERPEMPVAFDVGPGWLQLSLPIWAAPALRLPALGEVRP